MCVHDQLFIVLLFTKKEKCSHIHIIIFNPVDRSREILLLANKNKNLTVLFQRIFGAGWLYSANWVIPFPNFLELFQCLSKEKATNISPGSRILKSWIIYQVPFVGEKCAWNIVECGQERWGEGILGLGNEQVYAHLIYFPTHEG